MPSTATKLCKAQASYKKTPGLLELTSTHLQWTPAGKQAPTVRVSNTQAACKSVLSRRRHERGAKCRVSSTRQQGRLCSNQAKTRARWRRCGAYIPIHRPGNGCRRARSFQDGAHEYHCQQPQRRRHRRLCRESQEPVSQDRHATPICSCLTGWICLQ